MNKRRIKQAVLKPMRPFCRRLCDHLKFVPPGHYYSPIPSEEDFDVAHAVLNQGHAGIDFRHEAQVQLLRVLQSHYERIPRFPDAQVPQFRFCYRNQYFSYSDATIFACLMQHLRPKRFIDIGGGVTTVLMMDLNDSLFSDAPTAIEVIEPNPERLHALLRANDSLNIRATKVQNVELEHFEQLEPNDVLFLDSTHVSKLGSDVNYIAFEVLPRLKPGVIVHLHEMFFPFEYPQSFFLEGKFWNELYFWRAFLMGNGDFEILLFNSYLERTQRELLEQGFPRYFQQGDPGLVVQCQGASMWLRKLKMEAREA